MEHYRSFAVLRFIILLHPTRVWKHQYVCNDTFGTLAAANKAGSATASRFTFRIGQFMHVRQEKRNNKQGKPEATRNIQISQINLCYGLEFTIFFTSKLSTCFCFGGVLILVLRLIHERKAK